MKLRLWLASGALTMSSLLAAVAVPAATLATTAAAGSATSTTTATACTDGHWPRSVQGKPTLWHAGARAGDYIWHDATGWHFRVTHATSTRFVFSGRIVSSAPLDAAPVKLEGRDYVALSADRKTITERVAAVAESLGLESLLDRRPSQLSGGQRQRVALGRAIVRTPKAFLLDEPLSNLDPGLRTQARAELRRLHRTLGATIVYVTHDQEEAMTLGDRIAVMRDGRVEQVGSPLQVYATPANTFVAGFIGAPAMNLLPAAALAGVVAPAGSVVGVRPQDVELSDCGSLRATVDLVEPRGYDTVIHLRPAAATIPPLLAITGGSAPTIGTEVFVKFPPDRLHLFDGRDGTRLPAHRDRLE